jgi:hypothetical protein
MKSQIPNPKIPNPKKIPKSQMTKSQNKPRKHACAERRRPAAGRGEASPFGICDLEFGIFLEFGIL